MKKVFILFLSFFLLGSAYYALSCYKSLETTLIKVSQAVDELRIESSLLHERMIAVKESSDDIDRHLGDLKVNLDLFRKENGLVFHSISTKIAHVDSSLINLAEQQKAIQESEADLPANTQLPLSILREELTDLASDKKETLEYLEQNPNDIKALIRMGNIYLEEGDIESAVIIYNGVIDIDPSHLIALQGLGRISLKEQDYEQSVYLFSRLCRLEPNNPVHHYHLAQGLFLSGALYEADDAIEKSLEIDDTSTLSLKLAGDIYRKSGKLIQASAYYEKSLEYQADPHVYSLLGDVFKDLGMNKKAYFYWESALGILDGNTLKGFEEMNLLFGKMAFYALELRDYRKVQDYFRRTEQYGGNEDVYYLYLQTLRIRGDEENLSFFLSDFEKKYPDSKYQSETTALKSGMNGA